MRGCEYVGMGTIDREDQAAGTGPLPQRNAQAIYLYPARHRQDAQSAYLIADPPWARAK